MVARCAGLSPPPCVPRPAPRGRTVLLQEFTRAPIAKGLSLAPALKLAKKNTVEKAELAVGSGLQKLKQYDAVWMMTR